MPERGEKATTRAAAELLRNHHERELCQRLRHVREEVDRWAAGEPRRR